MNAENNKKWEEELKIIINETIKQNFEELFLKGNDACRKELKIRISEKDDKNNT